MDDIRESREERFKRLATFRTNEVLDRLRILGNCSNHQMYKYTKEDVNKIFFAIEKKMKEVRAKFNQYEKKEKFCL